MRIAFNHLWPSAITGALQKEHEYLGYDKWLQLELGEALIRKYIQQAKELEGTPRKRLKINSAPTLLTSYRATQPRRRRSQCSSGCRQTTGGSTSSRIQRYRAANLALCLPSHREEALVSSLTVPRSRVISALPAT